MERTRFAVRAESKLLSACGDLFTFSGKCGIGGLLLTLIPLLLDLKWYASSKQSPEKFS